MGTFYFWNEIGKRNRFDLYGFLNDEYFDTSVEYRRIAIELREIPPHELYGELENYAPNRCGKKRTAQIVDIIEKYRRFNNKHFCDCGEPYLHWYKFCPVCGKERGNQ